VRHQLTAP